MHSEIPERAQCKSLCSQDMRESENEKSEQDRTSTRMKGWAARLPHRFSSAEWITDTYFQLRVEFLKFGLGGKRCLWQSPVWFWWELATNPHTHTHANSSILTFRLIHCTNSSRRSRDRYPCIPRSIHLQEREMRMLVCSLLLFINFPKQISGCVFVVVEAIWFA